MSLDPNTLPETISREYAERIAETYGETWSSVENPRGPVPSLQRIEEDPQPSIVQSSIDGYGGER